MESTRANKRFRFLALAAAMALALPAGAAAAQVSGGTSPPGGGSGSSGGGSAGNATGTSGGTSTGGGSAKKSTGTPQAKGKSKAQGKKAPPQPAVTISSARCVPASNCDTKEHEVSTHGTLLLQGKGLKSGQAVAFPHSWDARIASNSPTAHLHSSTLGLVVTVPASAHSGRSR